MSGTTATSFLESNLAALGTVNATIADAVRRATPRDDLSFAPTDDLVPTATMDGVRLASARRPLDEARRLAASVDLTEAAVVVVVGFGLGYHVRALAERAGRTTVLLVFEPDLSMLRRVLETVDHAQWLRDAMVVFATESTDRTALGRLLAGAEPIVAQGVTILEHPPSRRRLGSSAAPFCRLITDVVDTTRTTMVTTLARAADTVENLLGNLEWYGLGAGIADLAGAARNRLGVVVSAGPSLHRNIDQLGAPGVRDRCVIVAVQTTLKPLLAAGVRPHFVTALDYHEISTRFYEGLDPDDVRDTTLVIDPKAHPAIARAYPGPVRSCANEYLDRVLGPLARPMGDLPAGATVAHLALYLARHVGCNPIAFVGQDLGFTDGLYYAPGTAIHDVWSTELNPFNTVPMMEWQRIARHRLHLQELADVHGRPIFSDIQMVTYLRQFERDFARYADEGVRIIDATEGGVEKDGAECRPLAEVLDRWAGQSGLDPIRIPAAPVGDDVDERRAHILARLDGVARDVADLAATSERTRSLLTKMLRDQGHAGRMERHFDRLGRERKRVEDRFASFEILNEMNQLGAFKRMRADRRLQLAQSLSPDDRQRAQLERDRVNVEWLRDAGHELRRMIEAAGDDVRGRRRAAQRPTRQLGVVEARPVRIGAVVPIADSAGSWSQPLGDSTALQATLARLASCRGLDEIVILAPDGVDVDGAIDRGNLPRPVTIERTPGSPFGPEQDAIALARRWAGTCWRAGIAGMSAWDEALCPAAMATVAARRNLHAVVPCGADWCFIDPSAESGVDAVVARHRRHPDEHRFVFTQAPPGLGACVVATAMLAEFTVRTRLATLGGLLVYQPHAPQGDPIARDANVQIDPALRGAFVRAIPDTPRRRRHLERVRSELGTHAEAAAVARALTALEGADRRDLPQHVIVELTPRRRATGILSRLPGGRPQRPDMSRACVEALMTALSETGDAVISFAGTGDPLEHPDWPALLQVARDAGLPVHVRTELQVEGDAIAQLAQLADVVSVEVHGDRAETHRAMLGRDGFSDLLARVQHLVDHRRHRAGSTGSSGISLPWIVPRCERRAETLGDINAFFDRWQHVLGTAVIDPVPPFPDTTDCPRDALTDAREPASARAFEARRRLLVWSDGAVPVSEIDVHGRDIVGTVDGPASIARLFSSVLDARAQRDSFRMLRP